MSKILNTETAEVTEADRRVLFFFQLRGLRVLCDLRV